MTWLGCLCLGAVLGLVVAVGAGFLCLLVWAIRGKDEEVRR